MTLRCVSSERTECPDTAVCGVLDGLAEVRLAKPIGTRAVIDGFDGSRRVILLPECQNGSELARIPQRHCRGG